MKKIKKIILIDDDTTSNMLNKLIIEKSGMADEIMTFDEAQNALDFIRSNDQDQDRVLILLDINMPMMDGWQFLSHYTKVGNNRNDKIVMLSSSIDPADMKKARDIREVMDFISKPLSVDTLDSLVRKYIN